MRVTYEWVFGRVVLFKMVYRFRGCLSVRASSRGRNGGYG